ncbi:MAG: FAD-binding protein [Propionicimonas sp.]|nr:FAD-binding protein [Propionicimonas sp.]
MALAHLSSALDGSLVQPGSADYELSRMVHGRPCEPAAVVHAASVADVARAVVAARAEGLPVAVRGGGHSLWESLPGALVIDLAALDTIELEGGATGPGGTRVVRVGGGATWGEVADHLGGHGLAVSSGDTRSVGVGGLTLGAGIGWVVRCWGLALDQLVGVQLVTAGGDVVEVSESSHPDLFWGVRGGGGNLGVATRLDFLAHPLEGVVHASLALDPAGLPDALRAFRDVMREAPWELNGSLVATPAFGPEMPSRTVLELAWAGTDEAAAREAMAPLLALPQLLSAEVGRSAYADLLQEPPAPPPGMPMPTIVDENGWFPCLDDEVVDDLLAARESAGAAMLLVRWLGGRFSAIDPQATAVAFRAAEAFVMTAALLPPGAPEDEVSLVKAKLSPFVTHALGTYGNFTNSVLPGLAGRMYPAHTHHRLRVLKREWDPDNTFARNHNVVPATS